MPRDYTVIRYGVDSSSRTIWMTQWMIDVWEALLRMPEVEDFAWKLTIIQGAFMTRVPGGGASASAGYHNAAGCLDIRTWNLTADELSRFIHASRKIAFPFWRRDYTYLHGGMDPHAHGTLGTDHPLTSGAQDSWSSYVHGGDGLAGSRSDYEWRPSPLVTVPPAQLLEEDYLMTSEAQKALAEANRRLERIENKLDNSNSNQKERDVKLLEAVNAAKKAQLSKSELVTKLGGLADQLGMLVNSVDDDATKAQVRELKRVVLQALADDPDVDGADNPIS